MSAIIIAMRTDSKTLSSRLRLLQLSYFSALAGLMNYLTLYLSHRGLGEMEIGIFYALGSLGIVLQQYLFGRLLDRTGRYRAASALVMLFSAISTLLVPALMNLLPVEIALLLLLYSFIKRYGSVYDIWIWRLRQEYEGLEYGSTRGMGSLGEGLMGLLMGHLIAWGGWNAMFYATGGLFLVSFFSTVRVPDPGEGGEEKKEKVRFVPKGRLARYFESFLVLKSASAVVSIFAPLLLERIGSGPETYGRIIMLCAVVEVFTFTFWPRVMKVIGKRCSYLASVLSSIICCLLLSLSRGLFAFTVGRVMLSVSFVTYTLSQLDYIDGEVGESEKAQAVLTLSAISSGIGYMVSSLLGGIVMERGTPLSMALMTGAMNVLAFILHFRAFRGIE